MHTPKGGALLGTASRAYGFDLNLSELVRIWKGGSIIRAKLLDTIQKAFEHEVSARSASLPLAPEFAGAVNELNGDWRYTVRAAHALAVPCPAVISSLNYFDSYRSEHLPANLIPGPRDFFGAHTYRRVDRHGYFHTEWEPEAAPKAAEAAPTPNQDLVGENEKVERA